MGLPTAIVVVAGALILSAAQARAISPGEGKGNLATPLTGTSIALAVASPRLGAPTSTVRFRNGGTVAAQTAEFAAAAVPGACASASCSEQIAHQVITVTAPPNAPSHVLVLAAVGAVAFMAGRRRIGD
jgi:hypothetical protein